jgi:hypothetical protein
VYIKYKPVIHKLSVSPGTPVSSTTKTGRHDIAEILLKMALKHQKSITNHIKIWTWDEVTNPPNLYKPIIYESQAYF